MFISSFEINKVNPFAAFTAAFKIPLVFLSNIFIAFEVILLTNPGKLFLAEGIARSVITFLCKLPNTLQSNPPD